ncbi:NUDIX domain-containing protein [Streptomyces lonarensis]|nr:NUDIX domain-containing protein [Streptomyces lonarensis]
MDEDEVLDVVDAHDEVTGRAPRGEVYRDRLLHRCAAVLVTDGQGRIFVHRRTATKLIHPGLYDMFVGGVVGAGEGYAAAAWREAREELGAPGLPEPEPVLRFLFEGEGGSWWTSVHRVRWDGPVRPQPSEVAWHAFLTPEELADRLDTWQWAPDGLAAWLRLSASPGR